MSKPTVAYVLQYFPILTETFVYREVRALRARGFDIVTLSNRTPDPAQLSAEARDLLATTEYVFPLRLWPFLLAHLFWLLRHPRRYLGTLWRVMSPRGESWSNRVRTLGHFGGGVYLAHRMRRRGIQHVHAHFSVNAATIALVLSALLEVGYSFTVHNNIFTDRLILREKLASAAFIAAISEYSRDWLLRYAPDLPDLRAKFSIVHCGIDLADFPPAPQPVEQSPPVLLSMAGLSERKGMPVLIEACRVLRDRGVAVRCIIAGDGPQRAELERQIARHALGEVVTLAGRYFQEQIIDYLTQADLFVLACITARNGDVDGVPVVLMEAMAMERPTISTTVSGIPELIEDGVSGLLVPEQAPEALADAIERLLNDRALAARLGRAGRAKVSAEFNITHSADQLAALFEQQTAARRP